MAQNDKPVDPTEKQIEIAAAIKQLVEQAFCMTLAVGDGPSGRGAIKSFGHTPVPARRRIEI